MFPTVTLGPFVLPTGGLVYIAGLWLALTAVERGAARLRLDVEAVYGVAATAALAGFLAARAFFVFLYWPAFSANPLSIIWPLTSGYDPGAGVLMAAAAGAWLVRRRRLPAAEVLDALTPGLLATLAAVFLVDFLAGPGYGDETTHFWGIVQFGVRRHPVQLYQTAFIALALLAWMRATANGAYRAGAPFLSAAAVVAAGLVVTAPWHANPWLLSGGWHGLQLVGLATLLAALGLLARLAGDDG